MCTSKSPVGNHFEKWIKGEDNPLLTILGKEKERAISSQPHAIFSQGRTLLTVSTKYVVENERVTSILHSMELLFIWSTTPPRVSLVSFNSHESFLYSTDYIRTIIREVYCGPCFRQRLTDNIHPLLFLWSQWASGYSEPRPTVSLGCGRLGVRAPPHC